MRTLNAQAIEAAQRAICARYGAAFISACDGVNSGFAMDTEGNQPVSGLRHPETEDTTGWYLWCGQEYSNSEDFFKPLHTRHLYERFPEVTSLLGLPPGYRFLVSGSFVDVWFDPKLLQA
jgi:hypothetical protein